MRILEIAEAELLGLAQGLGWKDRDKLMSDWAAGKSFLRTQLELKYAWRKNLPYLWFATGEDTLS